ncbi:MAG: MerR family transcriptional regulator [Anaerostipes sp.]|jgi:DNA-binding transcriptional MerR regulator|nr:MerR family transcriptional regulator [Anaerostipes sp.]MDD3746149.1 MerR family transcriptional regulator [Anaerostipes sp.]
MKTYSIGEVSKMLHISISTLRYYDKEGLLRDVERTEGGIRMFKDKDIRHLNLMECLKRTGMSLKNIRQYFDWCEQGDSTIKQRHELFIQQQELLEQQIKDLTDSLDMVKYKRELYRIAEEEHTLDSPKLLLLKETASKKSDYVKELVAED